MTTESEHWRKCNTCKKPIQFLQKYWVCSVSTCNRVRTGLVFCSVSCFDAHVPMMNHRDAGAFEKLAPSRSAWEKEMSTLQETKPEAKTSVSAPSKEILVVVSKMKDYIRTRSALNGSEMNTSDRVMEVLSDRLRQIADQAILKARQEGRKTVLDRDL